MRLIRFSGGLLAGLSLTILSGVAVGAQSGTVTVGSAGVVRYIEKGQPPVVIHLTVEQAQSRREAKGGGHGHGPGGGTHNLIYNGGTNGIGVETAPEIYLVLWGSQWSNDPSHEASALQSFLAAMGGSSWLNTVTQYCENVSSGTIYCTDPKTGVTSGTAAGSGMYPTIFAGTVVDEGSPAPNKPRQSQIAAEAVNAASIVGKTTAGSNDNVQYVIATAHGYNSNGFGTQYCAYHSYTTSSYGDIAYTNLPYITDAGASCGANFNGLGPDAGITIVEGHEAAETITDPFPSSGWLDSSGSEIGDKCAWILTGTQGASAAVTLSDGNSYAVQSLWSNAPAPDSNNETGCVLSY